jgi:flagellar hook-associated protein 1 FlgK
MSFDGLRIALSSLQAQRRALEVTGQNVANVATDGYSRQRIDMAANAGSVVPAIYATPSNVGQGVLSSDVKRARDQFIEVRANQEHAVNSNLLTVQATLDRIELGFAEPGENGLGAQMSDFLAGFDDVANQPGDSAARNQLIEQAQTLVTGFTQLDTTLAAIRDNSVEQLQASMVDVNATASRIAELNGRIQVATTAGLSPNDLMDQRDLAASQLAESVGATVRPLGDGTVDVYIGGTALVRGSTSNELQVVVGTDPAQTISVVWAKDSQPAGVTGAAGGMITTANDIVPRYRAELKAVATKLHDEVNAIHSTGYGQDGVTGRDFFSWDATGHLAVDPAIASDPTKVGASASATATRDGSVAKKLAALTGTQATYRALVVKLGVESQTATRRVEIQAGITDQIDTARQASSGVDVDEEMTNMLMFQHAYDAAARLLSTMDGNLDTLINHMGAGR